MRALILAVLAFINTACASWPEEGKGGWAENFQRHPNGAESIWYEQGEDQLRQDMDILKLRLGLMRARGIAQCMPAQVRLATLAANRITRQLVAEMYQDVEEDLTVFYHQINLLEKHFNHIREKTLCASNSASIENQIEIATTVEEMLNSDNQFAYTDENITPKYAMRIKQAAELANTAANLHILLIGHTDAIGNEVSNIELGLLRAQRVKQALIENGLNANQIAVTSNGEKTPFHGGMSLATRLSNRRVEAFVKSIKQQMSERNKAVTNQDGMPLRHWTHALNISQENEE